MIKNLVTIKNRIVKKYRYTVIVYQWNRIIFLFFTVNKNIITIPNKLN